MSRYQWALWGLIVGLSGCVRTAPDIGERDLITESPYAAQNTYTAQSSYAREVQNFPFIQIASSDLRPGIIAYTDISYVRYGNRVLQLDLYQPQDADGSTPGVILVHGGGWRDGVRENLTPLAIALADRGIVAATISYRLSPEAQYPAAIHDAKAAVRWLRLHAGIYGADPDRIAIAGSSAGGQIAALVGLTNGRDEFDPQAQSSEASSRVQAIVNIDGLSDFTSEEARRHEDDPSKNPSSAGAWLGGRYAEQRERWHEASPITHVSASAPPMLFFDSGRPRFSVGQDALVERLEGYGVPYQVHAMGDTPHTFWLFDPWLEETAEVMAEFLNRH
ncbi:alpha/beta hydrolase [Marinimicrobium alkaliphilum]|uniref:alpha/beta hydrolase n=1 Tax=Marinimicrobium alkaliphilum TaxID=2202654 RepID=UPI000DBAA8B0|nr:alpha/beta hydrolase [Marinimicrobium alkaliphilum]